MRASYQLPDKDCERLNRTEMQAVQMTLATLSTAAYAQDDLKKRLECIPDGVKRFRLALGGLRSVANDIIGTISVQQAKHIRNTMNDMELRLVPKLTPVSVNLIFTKDEAKELMDCAREMCVACTEDADSCRKCRLYKVMETHVPLESYNGLICPYSLAEWEE